MRAKLYKLVQTKGQVNSNNVQERRDDKVIDHKNIETCMHCPYPDCKTGNCKLIKK